MAVCYRLLAAECYLLMKKPMSSRSGLFRAKPRGFAHETRDLISKTPKRRSARKGEEERSMGIDLQNAERVERFRKLKAQYQGTVLQLADPE